ncbi:MAG: FkbM family methyltransferase [Patescibacteria group bacterium]
MMFYTKANNSKSFVYHRMAMIAGWRSGALTFQDAILLALPARILPRRNELTSRYESFLNEQSEKEIRTFMDKDYPNVFENILGNSKLSLIFQIFVKDEYKAKSFLKPDSVVIDAGGNIGIFAIFSSLHCPQGKIFSFEPVTKTYGIMLENIKKYPNIRAMNIGLGEKGGDQTILTSSWNAGISAVSDSSLALKNSRFFDGSEKIQIITIDDMVEHEHISHVDVIKIDTEGYEASILKGAQKTIFRDKPIITMSAYHNKDDKTDLPKILKAICPEYKCEQYNRYEEDMVCSVTS